MLRTKDKDCLNTIINIHSDSSLSMHSFFGSNNCDILDKQFIKDNAVDNANEVDNLHNDPYHGACVQH